MSGEPVDATDKGPKEIRVDLPVDAHIPESYINSERLRLEVYRRLAEARDDDALTAAADDMVDRFGALPTEVEHLMAVARLRNQARAAGVADILTQGARIKLHPVELPDSKQVRLKRLYPGANYRAAAKTLQVPMPRESKAINSPNLRDMELLQWVADFMSEMLDAPKVSVAGSTVAEEKPKKKVFSVSE